MPTNDPLHQHYLAIKRNLSNKFTAQEISDICLELGFNPEHFHRQILPELVDSLLHVVDRHNRHGELITFLRRERQSMTWPDAYRYPSGPEPEPDWQHYIPPSLPIEPDVRTYLTDLLWDSGIRNLDPELREEFIQQLFVRLDNYLTTVIINNLPFSKLEEFVTMNEQGQPKWEIEQYLKKNIPNVEEVFKNAFIDFRSLYLSKMAEARQNKPKMP
jgi:hypothetical protein